jgi:sugar lactone lactonase YvrE
MKVTQKLLVPAVMALLGTACGANNMAYQQMPANYYNNPAYTGANSAYPGGTGTPMNPYPDMTGLDSNLPTGTLMGKVVDSLNKAGLGSVRVQVVGVNPPLMTTTDASGNFTLSNVPQGRQVLTVQRNDYTNVNGNNNITAEVKAGTTVALPQSIELVPFRASAVNGFIRAFNNFKQPRGIALATATNNLYVVDVVGAGGLSNYDHGEIKKLSADGGIIDAFGAPFSGNRLFSTDMFRLLKRPNGIAVDTGGNVFVANTGHNLVRRYGPAGQWLSNIEADFQELYDVAVQSTGDVIVSDPGSGALVLLDSSLNVRVPNLMRMPANGLRGITTTNNDDILVVNASAPAGQVIMKFDRYGNRLPLAFGRIGGVQPASFSNPTDLAVDNRNGDIYVVDSGNNRVQRFDSEGNYLSEFGSFGTQNGQFNAPWGIAIDNEGFVYVSDTKNMRVQKFAPGRSVNQPALGAAVPFS